MCDSVFHIAILFDLDVHCSRQDGEAPEDLEETIKQSIQHWRRRKEEADAEREAAGPADPVKDGEGSESDSDDEDGARESNPSLCWLESAGQLIRGFLAFYPQPKPKRAKNKLLSSLL